MSLSIGVIGSGIVGQTLSAGYAKKGHAVTIGTRSAEKLSAWGAANPSVRVGSFADAASCDVVVLAVGGAVAQEALTLAGVEQLAGKLVMDACNPIGGPPKDGFLPFFTGPNDSLIQRLQAQVPAAHFVKAFSSVGAAAMIDPAFAGGPPTMFICGEDAGAKATATALLAEVGWEVEDVGGVVMGGPVEALCQLWCSPGFRKNDWFHAFKVLR